MSSKLSIKSIFFFIAIIGTIWAWCVHQYNLNFLSSIGANTQNGMVHTADDASYVVPGNNFIKYGVWKDNSQGVSAYVQRPPLIGMIQGALSFFGAEEWNGYQKYISLLLHFFSIFVFGLIVQQLSGNKPAIILQSFYAFLPIFWGFLFYYISESLTPSFFIFLLYGYIMFQQYKLAKWLIFQAFISCLILLIRPQLAIFLAPFIYSLILWIREKHYRKAIVFIGAIILSSGCFIGWEIRSISISNMLQLHPIYHVTNNSQYRPVHGSFTTLYKSWEHVSAKFHSHMISIWYGSPTPALFEKNFARAMNEIPPHVHVIVPDSTFRDLFQRYNQVGKLNQYWEVNDLPVPGETQMEKQLRLDINKLAHLLKHKLWMDNNIGVPLGSARWTFTKSQLNLKIFQTKFRGQWWMEGLRYSCVVFISFLTVLSLSNIANRKNKMFLVLSFSMVGYLFYLFFIQKMNEERYLMPLLPVMLLMAFDKINRLTKRITKEKASRQHSS